MHKFTRTLRSALGPLFVGVLLSIGIGWVCGMLPDIRSLAVTSGPVNIPARWPAPVPADWPAPNGAAPIARDVHRSWWVILGTRVSADPASPADPSVTVHSVWIAEFGFPFRCLRSRRAYVETPAATTPVPLGGWREGNFVPPGRWTSVSPFARQIAFEPLPLGLALNSLIYGAGVWAFSRWLSRWYARRRIQAGQCPHCRYTVGNLPVCPECGHTTPITPLTPTLAPTPTRTNPTNNAAAPGPPPA